MSKKIALISGITGQDGSYLAELLLSKNYIVHGIKRKSSSFNTSRIDHIFNNKDLFLHYGDVTDSLSVNSLVEKIKPDEIYNLAAQSHVSVSFDLPLYTSEVDALGTMRFLESIKNLDLISKTKFYQASTSELFGKVREVPQNEDTPFYPRSPYGVAKLFSYWAVINYREAHKMHASNGILFNHESPRRGETFVTRKITMAAAAISKGIQEELYLGNLNAKRDWGHAKDFVEMMWLILQQDEPSDYVAATGECYTVKEFVEKAFKVVNIDIIWKGSGLDEVGISSSDNKEIIKVSKKYFRPAEVEELVGDYSKAKKNLNWEPKVSLEELVEEMVLNDLESLNNLK